MPRSCALIRWAAWVRWRFVTFSPTSQTQSSPFEFPITWAVDLKMYDLTGKEIFLMLSNYPFILPMFCRRSNIICKKVWELLQHSLTSGNYLDDSLLPCYTFMVALNCKRLRQRRICGSKTRGLLADISERVFQKFGTELPGQENVP